MPLIQKRDQTRRQDQDRIRRPESIGEALRGRLQVPRLIDEIQDAVERTITHWTHDTPIQNADGTANVLAVLPEADNAVIQALYKKIARANLKAQEAEEQRKQEAAVNKPVGQQPAANTQQEHRAAA